MKRFFAFILLAVAICAPLFSVQALAVSDLADTMSNQIEGEGSDHTIRFKNTNAISTSNQTIQLTFASEFDLGAITVSDIFLSHGPASGLETQEVVAASAAVGVWGATIVGNSITLTSPTDAGAGEIPGGDEVRITIGLEPGGASQIANPGTEGSYTVSIGGTFGGTGLVRVPIVTEADGSFTIGFTVPVASTSPPPTPPTGGGAPPVNPPLPAPEPIISNVRISAVTPTSAQVDWETNVSAASSFSFYNPTTLIETPVTNDGPSLMHRAVLTGLTPGTNYSFVLRAVDARGHSAFYGPGGWRTSAASVIENIASFRAQRQADGGVRLEWVLTNQIVSDVSLQIVIVRRTDRYPSGTADGQVITTTRGQSFSDLPGSGAAFYTAFVTDGVRISSGSLATIAAMSSTPTPTPTPTPVPVPPSNPSTSSPAPTLPPSGMGASTPTVPTPAPAGGGTVTPTSTAELPSITISVPTSPSSTESTPVTPINPTPRSGEFVIQPEWRTSSGMLVLAKGKETPSVLTGDGVVLSISTSEEIVSGQVTVDGSYYALGREAAKQYSAAFVPATAVGTVAVRLSVKTASGETYTINQDVSVVAPARILQKEKDRDVAAQSAEVQLFIKEGSTWRALPDSKQRISEDGTYRFYASAGTYRLEAAKEGWNTTKKQFVFMAAGPIQGVLVLEKGIQNPLNAIDSSASTGENIVAVSSAIVESVGQVLGVIRTPEAQAAAEVAAPLAIATTVGATAAASAFNLFAYLRFFLTQPLLLLRRRRREKWGLVYHSLTKQPIELAVVRLLDQKTGALRQTRITDALGRFAFLAKPGAYRIEVVKPGFVFPSAILASQRVDVDLVDLYHGEGINAAASVTLTPNIPIDPVEKTETPKEIIRRKQWRRVQQFASVASLAIAGIALVLQPTPFMIGCTLFQVVAFLIFRRLAVPPKPKSWGIAYDGHTRKPLKQAVIRIFDKKYNKLLETQVTDRDGKYAFFAGKNVYYVTAERSDYERTTSKDIDLRNEAFGVIHEPLPLLVKSAPTTVTSSSSA